MARRIFASACLLVGLAGCLFAQDSLKALSDRLSGGTAAFDYSFSTAGADTPFSGSGTAFVSGSRYNIAGNGLDIRCDGAVRYTADPAAGEMVIEAADGDMLDFLSNPALLLRDIGTNFKVERVSSESGREVYSLVPVADPSVTGMTLILEGGVPVAAELLTKDNGRMEFKVSGFRFTEETVPWAFSSEELEAYSSITDLR